MPRIVSFYKYVGSVVAGNGYNLGSLSTLVPGYIYGTTIIYGVTIKEVYGSNAHDKGSIIAVERDFDQYAALMPTVTQSEVTAVFSIIYK